MADPTTILTMKWGTTFSADYVNVLYRACRAASVQDFNFVCLTDDPNEVTNEVRTLPIPEIGLAPEDWTTPGIWPKLALYKRELADLRGRCLFIDLDMMVFRDLDSFLNVREPFVSTDMGPAWYPDKTSPLREPGTCLFSFEFGQESQIIDRFQDAPQAAMRDYKNEQEFVAEHANSMAYWPDGWVISFKRWLRQPIGKDLLVQPFPPPSTAKVLAFHGKPRPKELMRSNYFWDRFPHLGNGKVDWVVDYWKAFGGRIPT